MILLTLVCLLAAVVLGNPNHSSVRQQQLENLFRGTQTLVPGRSIYGSVIMTDYMGDLTKAFLAMNGTAEGAMNPNFKAFQMAASRGAHSRTMLGSLPFPVLEWPPIYTKNCPHRSRAVHTHTERGLALAHYQIWIEFSYFDHDVLKEKTNNRTDLKEYSSTDFSSVSNHFTYSAANGTLLKDGIPFLDDDIMVIFEDDIEIAVHNHSVILQEELSTMDVDLLFLGWCDGRLARPVPLCAHAYAITRRASHKLIRHFEPCGKALDEQFVIMGKNKWITYRTAQRWRFDKFLKEGWTHGKTKGIFQQLKTLGSLNGH